MEQVNTEVLEQFLISYLFSNCLSLALMGFDRLRISEN